MRDEFEQVSAAGALALPYLIYEAERNGHHLGKRIDTLALIDDSQAYETLKTYQGCSKNSVIQALIRNAPRFGQERVIRDLLVPLNIQEIVISWDSLKGLEQLKNLKSVSIQSSDIEDLSFLEKLTTLQSLTLDNLPKVSDLSFLEKLTTLQSLTLNSLEKVSDLSFLEKLSYLPFLESFQLRQNVKIYL